MWYRTLTACAALLALTALGCSKASPALLCGLEQPVTPDAPVLGDFPRTATTAAFPIAGTRRPGTAVRIDGVEAVAASCDRYWSATLDLSGLTEGVPTDFVLEAEAPTGNRSATVTLTVTLDTTPPVAPGVGAPASVSTGTVPVTGTGDPGDTVLVDGHPLAVVDGFGNFGADLALPLGSPGGTDNVFSFTEADPAGNVSPATPLTVTRTSIPTEVPQLFYPLHRQRVPPTAAPDQLLLQWGLVTDPAATGFRVQVADSPSFAAASIRMDQSGLPLSPGEATFTAPTVPGTYYWRVGTEDGTTVSYGPARRFTLGKAPGDVTGDGLTDILVGAPGHDLFNNPYTFDDRGRVDLFRGDPLLGTDPLNPEEIPTAAVLGAHAGDEFGIAVTTGDLDGDGVDDLIAGAHRVDVNARNAGAVYILRGGSGVFPPGSYLTAADADLALYGHDFEGGFGVTVASGFDLNGDGCDDLAVGEWQYDVPGTTPLVDAGRAYVFFGCPAPNTLPDDVPDLILTGAKTLENLGAAIGGGFDLNGDGYDDLAVGGPLADAPPPAAPPPCVDPAFCEDAGRVLVYYGGPAVDGAPDLVLYGDQDSEHFGAAVAGAGDLDDDGFDELAASAPLWDSGPTTSMGRVRIYRGASAPAATPSTLPTAAPVITVTGGTCNDAYGLALSGGGDVNGDGLADLAVGTPTSNVGAGPGDPCTGPTNGDLGIVDVYFGFSPLGPTSRDARFIGESPLDWLGFGLHLTADVNGDTLDDLVFGAPQNDLPAPSPTSDPFLYSNVGRAYAVFGGAGAPWSPGGQNAADIGPLGTVPGAVLPNDRGQDSFGSALH